MYFSAFYYDIDPQSVDVNRNVKIPHLVSLLLNTAGRSSDEYKIGIDQLMSEGKSWVLSRLALEMKRMPRHNERIRVDTWIETVERMFSLRNFQIVSDGDIIGEARSVFTVIDINTRRPVNMMEEERFAKLSTGCQVNIDAPTKIGAATAEPSFHYTTLYSDIDFNGHCNSARYIEWMLNALPLDTAKKLTMKRFEINYMRELMPGDNIHIAFSENENKLTFDVKNDEGVSVARAMII